MKKGAGKVLSKKNLTGIVKWFNNRKGYGFIDYDNMSDVFVHYSVISKEGYRSLNEGDAVEFTLNHTIKGLQASNVEVKEKTTV